MEEQILLYYLKVFSLVFIIFLFLIFFYTFYVLSKNISLSNNLLTINKGEKFENFFERNFKNFSKIEILAINKYYQINNYLFNQFIHYGDFYLNKNISSFELFKVITKSSNVLNKITIIEGWSQLELENKLLEYFSNFNEIPYSEIIADTYFFEKNKNFSNFLQNIKKYKNEYFIKHTDNKLLKKYSQNEIMIIGSLIEKEGLDINDKRKISSVIFNRLDKKMKLQIDATVIYAITDGKYNLNRKLLLKDLKFNHPYNTYTNYGLPPKPISYVGKKTLDIIFENHKSDFLFYFFDNSLKKHIFSKNYKEHKNNLNAYRNKQ